MKSIGCKFLIVQYFIKKFSHLICISHRLISQIKTFRLKCENVLTEGRGSDNGKWMESFTSGLLRWSHNRRRPVAEQIG